MGFLKYSFSSSIVILILYLCFPFFNPTVINAAQTAYNKTGAVSGDSLAAYTNSINSEINLYIRFIIGLAIVIILLILTLWVLKQVMKLRVSGVADNAIDVLAIRYVEQRKAVALVRVLNRVLIVGIAENSLTTLGELTSEEIGSLKLEKKTLPGIWNNTFFTRFFGKKSGR